MIRGLGHGWFATLGGSLAGVGLATLVVPLLTGQTCDTSRRQVECLEATADRWKPAGLLIVVGLTILAAALLHLRTRHRLP